MIFVDSRNKKALGVIILLLLISKLSQDFLKKRNLGETEDVSS
ncbi:hypothetical protein ES703_83925 [subsurface metagenome]